MDCPQQVLAAIRLLEARGFEAYAVGGCVRDGLLGLAPHDWDICTAALTEEMKAVFSGFRLVETGIAHGTLTVNLDGLPLEITTYRMDGPYSDHRRPDGVHFTSRLRDDLARRDFTVNAMAWHPERGLQDPFGGKSDLENRMISGSNRKPPRLCVKNEICCVMWRRNGFVPSSTACSSPAAWNVF